jgi:hypothetical protein
MVVIAGEHEGEVRVRYFDLPSHNDLPIRLEEYRTRAVAWHVTSCTESCVERTVAVVANKCDIRNEGD